MRVGRDVSEVRGELLERTSCGCIDDWLAVVSDWSHCTGSTLSLEARAVLVLLMPLFLWLQAQQTSSCELYCAFYSFPLRLVTQQHFHPCEQRRIGQAQNWVRVYYRVPVSIILYRSNVTIFSSSCSVCILLLPEFRRSISLPQLFLPISPCDSLTGELNFGKFVT